MPFDKCPPRLHLIAHQGRKNVICLNGVIKGGPVFVKNLGVRTGGRAEAGFGFLTPVGGRNIFWDFNMGPHLYYDNQKGGDFWNKAKFSPAVVLGASFFLEN